MKTRGCKVAMFFLVFVGAVFFTTPKAKGISMDPYASMEKSDVRYTASVEQLTVQCFDFPRLHKKVCAHEGSELASASKKKTALDVNFIAMVVFSGYDAKIPQTSWLEIVEFSSLPEVFVSLSDGTIVYGAGKGSTFEEAINNLAFNFLARVLEDTYEEGVGVKKPAGHITI